MKTFFIADLHFGHKNCLAFDNRPFKDIEEHDNALIERWNAAVGKGDEVWILGDMSWVSAPRTVEILKRLNGTKRLCIGNHDHKLIKNAQLREQFAEITNYKELALPDGRRLVLCHYPIPCYNKHFYGWIHLYGHVHTGFEWNMMQQVQFQMQALYDRKCRMYNVGCMVPGMDYTPRTLDEILELFEKTDKAAPGETEAESADE